MAFTDPSVLDEKNTLGSDTPYPPATGKPQPAVGEPEVAIGAGALTPTEEQAITGTGFTAEQLFYGRFTPDELAGMTPEQQEAEWHVAQRDEAAGGVNVPAVDQGIIDVSAKWGPQPSKAVPEKTKGGGRKSSVSLTGQIPGQVDPAVQQAYLDHLGRLTDAESIYQQARSDALGWAMNLNVALGDALAADLEGTRRNIDDLLTKAETEMAAVEELVQRAQSNRINPGQFFANVGDAGRFSAALAVGAGAMATAFGGGPNVAYQIIEGAIERNVRAQALNQHHDRAMISHQLNFVNTIRGLAGDRANLANLMRVGLTAITQSYIGATMAGLGATQAGIASSAVYDQLGAKLAEAVIASQQNSGAKYKIQAQSMAQASAMLGVLTQAEGKAQQLQQGPSPSAGGAGGGRGVGRPTAAGAGPDAAAAMQLVTSRVDFDQLNDQQRAEKVREMFQTSTFASRTRVGIPEIEGLKNAVATNPKLGPGVAAFLETASDEEFASRGALGKESFHSGNTPFDLYIKSPLWEDVPPAKKVEIIAEVGANKGYLENIKTMRSIIGMISEGSGFASSLVRRGPSGELVIVPGEDEAKTALISTLSQRATEAAFYMRTKKGADAIRGQWELQYFDKLAKGEYTFVSFVADIARGKAGVRQARLTPYISFGNRELLRAAGPYFYVD